MARTNDSAALLPLALLTTAFLPHPAMALNCPVDAFVAQSNAESVLFYDDTAGTFAFVDADNDWKATPYTTLPASVVWTDDFTAVGTTSNSSEWGLGIDSAGDLEGFGSNVTTSIPSGSGPYSHPRTGSTGRFSVLNGTGTVVNWGNSANSWLTSEPATTGFTALDVGRDLGCAVSEVNNTGVTCYGYDHEGMNASASRPTTGYYQDVSVGRYVVVAVDTSNNATGWCTTRAASGYVTKCAQFISNMPTTGVESVEVNETGELVGVAYMTDGTITIWQADTAGIHSALRNAPGFTAYGSTADRVYVPEGPSGYITFVSQPRIAPYSSTSHIAAVIDDPMGLTDTRRGTYAYGDAVRWDNSSYYKGGLYYYEPSLVDACD